ncbi:peptidase inhibitor family I36 protein [Nonomuraea rhodomycinica]|uniref:Peptidase inhibitor family I36 protein n=1 Tax=Nonomuraea rhodomycinica TaxID=1712872 RepID=A0A7Y6IUM1_9ACTN|nr:peptidase inhibitor family I36 protein [Nonomuraea rhodomycinica]NUW44391.1 peptidase inhibitor family I36 protein [Nonomuraea rhodomycinica]
MKRRTTLVITAMLIGATSLIGSNATAQASSTAFDCPSFCLYEHDDFNMFRDGRHVLLWPHGPCYNVNSSMDNRASSMINDSGRHVRLYDRKNCAGPAGYTAKPHSADKDLTNNGFDNKPSSIK